MDALKMMQESCQQSEDQESRKYAPRRQSQFCGILLTCCFCEEKPFCQREGKNVFSWLRLRVLQAGSGQSEGGCAEMQQLSPRRVFSVWNCSKIKIM